MSDRDITLEDTWAFGFTTRSFTTGIPTTLAGTPVLSVKEEGNDTFITGGVSVDIDTGASPVAGMHEGTVVSTAANGYEVGKSYFVFISTGTVGGVSVVGEVLKNFTIQASAAAVDLANGTDGLGAIKAQVDLSALDSTGAKEATLTARTLLAAAYFDPAVDSVANVTLVATTTVNTDMRGSDIGTLNDLSAAQVNAEVLDVMTVDTFAEPAQGAPAATTTLALKIAFMYKAFRNLMTNDGTTIKLFDDAGTTVDQKATVSEAAGTVTRGEFGTGP